MANKFTPIDFEKLVHKHFMFLQKSFGYTINKIHDWQYNVESLNSRIMVLNEHGSLTVAIEPIGDGARQLLGQNIIPIGIEVTVICECLDPTLKYKPQLLANSKYEHDIPVEIEKRVELLKKYCESFIKGDYSHWKDIEACL